MNRTQVGGEWCEVGKRRRWSVQKGRTHAPSSSPRTTHLQLTLSKESSCTAWLQTWPMQRTVCTIPPRSEHQTAEHRMGEIQVSPGFEKRRSNNNQLNNNVSRKGRVCVNHQRHPHRREQPDTHPHVKRRGGAQAHHTTKASLKPNLFFGSYTKSWGVVNGGTSFA
jgi:hypothetical protein